MNDIVVTKWSPDSCGCVLNYSWIRGSDENTRIHVYHSADKICHDHEHLKRGGGHKLHTIGAVQDVNDDSLFIYETVIEENQRKNILMQHAVDMHPTKLARQIHSKQGDGRRQTTTTNALREDVSFNFFFTETAPDRVLNISFSEALNEQEKAVIEARFPGRVKVL
jgi:hypothetical protein